MDFLRPETDRFETTQIGTEASEELGISPSYSRDASLRMLRSRKHFPLATSFEPSISSQVTLCAGLCLAGRTRGYWSVFARIAHAISEESPFETFQVALARLTLKFPSDNEFAAALKERGLVSTSKTVGTFSLNSKNAGQNEPSPVSDYSIETHHATENRKRHRVEGHAW